jgi:iron complex transport system substrate-binding protein
MSTALPGQSARLPSCPPPVARLRSLRPALVVALATLLLAVAACSAAAPATSPGGTPVSRAAGGAPTAVASPALLAATASAADAGASVGPAPAFPLTITDDEGTSVTIPAPPQRIISLAPSITETLFALGEGARVVGVTTSDDYPPAATSLPQVASYSGVQLEKVVAQRPDLVIAWKGITSVADIARLRSLNMPVVVLYATTVQKVLADIGLVGEVTGEMDAGRVLVTALSERVAAIGSAASVAGPAPRVFYEIDATKQIYGPAPDDFTADMIRLAGGDPITSGTAGVYAISLERLVASDPQVIVLGDATYGTTAAQVAARPGWGGMSAVKSGAIRPIDDTIVTRPGPRIVDGLAALAEAIHPGLVLPSFGPLPSVVP